MYQRRRRSPFTTFLLTLGIVAFSVALWFVYSLSNEIELYEKESAESAAVFEKRVPQPFINKAADAEFTAQKSSHDAHYYYETPEGFQIYSYSTVWNREMLKLLYEELKLNTHGDEINKLYEINIYPHENNELSALATYSQGADHVNFTIQFPAFPKDFSVDFPIYTGKINIYGGDKRTTIESIAGSLSHEYGHHYTFYYMFNEQINSRQSLGESKYAKLREASKYDFILGTETFSDYEEMRHRYLTEVAAEDYVQIMGSPTTRQIVDYYDVKQRIEDDTITAAGKGERNAFPQENMTIPLAHEVEGLSEYFHSFIGTVPSVPIEEEHEIMLDFEKQSKEFRLVDGKRIFTWYTITWNTPYQDAVYTLACYDPYDYTGWGTPIKTVRLGEFIIEGKKAAAVKSASAVIGNYAISSRNTVYSMDDALAQGSKVFYVVAQLSDGTYYVSDRQEYNFG